MARIRIDYRVDGENVFTHWVKEDGNSHSTVGRVLCTKEEFGVLQLKMTQTDTADGYESTHYFNEKS